MASFCLLLAAALSFAAQTNSPAPVYPRNRYLLVIETSRAMSRRLDPLRQAIQSLLRSPLAEQAHPGDTIGLWTFNEDLYTGAFPLQQWSPDAQGDVSQRIDTFVKEQKYEKHARFDKVVAALDKLARNSQFITVIIVCLGEIDIQGTPFDGEINEFFRTWRLKQPGAGTPFVIALRAQAGRFVAFSLNPSPWPAELPPLPKELLTPLKAVMAAAPKPATSTVPNLIISGKKRDPAPPAAVVQQTPPVAATVATSVLAAPENSNPPQPIQTNASGLVQSLTSEKAPDTAQVVRTASVPNPSLASEPAGLVAKTQDQKSQPKGSTETSALTPESQLQAKPSEVATAIPVRKPIYLAMLIFTGFVSLGAITAAIWFWRGRARKTKEPSLITESFDRRKK